MAFINGREVLFSATVNISEDANGTYEEGYNALWDNLQNYGNRESYPQGFFSEWGGEEISPKHKVTPTGNQSSFFANSSKLKSIDKDKFDLSNATYHPTDETKSTTKGFCLRCFKLEVFPDIGLQAGIYSSTWAGCLELHTIEKIRVAEDTIFNVSSFAGCGKLQNINDIEGVFNSNLYIQSNPWSVATQKRIIKHLKNNNNSSRNNIAFIKTYFDALEVEGFTDEDKVWYKSTFGADWTDGTTWAIVIDDLNWNLTTQ